MPTFKDELASLSDSTSDLEMIILDLGEYEDNDDAYDASKKVEEAITLLEEAKSLLT